MTRDEFAKLVFQTLIMSDVSECDCMIEWYGRDIRVDRIVNQWQDDVDQAFQRGQENYDTRY